MNLGGVVLGCNVCKLQLLASEGMGTEHGLKVTTTRMKNDEKSIDLGGVPSGECRP